MISMWTPYGFLCGHNVVTTWTSDGFDVDMWFPGGHHMVSNVDITWFPCENHIVSMWT